MTAISRKVLIVGCGRWLRRDDQIGLMVAQSLLTVTPPDSDVFMTEAPATDIPNMLNDKELLIIVDAARSGAGHPPGSFERLNYRDHFDSIRSRSERDTHSLGVDIGLTLAGELGRLPATVWIYAIAIEDCKFGEDTSPWFAGVAKSVAGRVRADVAAWAARRRPCHA